MKRIIHYVNETFDFSIWYPKDVNFNLLGFCDANWARNANDKKSTSEGCFYYILDFCMAVVAWEFVVELSVYVWMILMRVYICENYYALEFMRLEFHELLEKKIGT